MTPRCTFVIASTELANRACNVGVVNICGRSVLAQLAVARVNEVAPNPTPAKPSTLKRRRVEAVEEEEEEEEEEEDDDVFRVACGRILCCHIVR